MSFDVDIVVRRGEREIACAFEGGAGVTALFGRSGAGKTSVLDAIAGLLPPERGRIAVAGRMLFDAPARVNVAVEERRAGYVFQDARLFPHLRVRGNLTFALPGRAQHDRWEDRLDFLGIGHLLDRWPRTLSGGEAKRVAIGRALLREPAFLLLDEPLSSLDRARREEVMIALEHLRDHSRLPILLVTHDRAEAERLGAAVVEIE